MVIVLRLTMSKWDLDHHTIILQKLRSAPNLDPIEECELFHEWKSRHKKEALEKIIKAHLKLVYKISLGYRGYGLPIEDLISEGHIGMMNAMKHYDPELQFRFSTYARRWIQAQIQEYVLKNWSLIKMGTTVGQKKIFFGLKRAKRELGITGDLLSNDDIAQVATHLSLTKKEVQEMDERLYTKDYSLNQSVSGEDDTVEWIEWIQDGQESAESNVIHLDEIAKKRMLLKKALEHLNKNEYTILCARRLSEPPKRLEELSYELKLSKERIRQLEHKAFLKIKKFILMHLEHNSDKSKTDQLFDFVFIFYCFKIM